MSYGPIQVFTGTIASGASTLTSIYLSKAYSRVFAEIGTMSTNVILNVYGSSDGSDFKPVYERANTASVQYQAVTLPTNVAGGMVPIDVIYPYVQFRGTGVVSGGVTIKLICVD